MKVTFLHTVSGVREFLENYVKGLGLSPDCSVEHVVAGELLKDVRDDPEGERELFKVFSEKVTALLRAADKVLVTCSSLGDFIEEYLAHFPDAALFGIDRPMADQTILLGRKVGIAVTNHTTIGPSTHLVQRAAGRIGKGVSVSCFDCKEELLHLDKEPDEDRRREILEKLDDVFSGYDVVMLAQVSIGKVIDRQGFKFAVPVLSSYVSGIEQLDLADSAELIF